VPVAHTCNPNYSGGSDQKDQVQRQPGEIVHETLSRKNPSQNSGVHPEYWKNRNKKTPTGLKQLTLPELGGEGEMSGALGTASSTYVIPILWVT
jgi:hypothetical protein